MNGDGSRRCGIVSIGEELQNHFAEEIPFGLKAGELSRVLCGQNGERLLKAVALKARCQVRQARRQLFHDVIHHVLHVSGKGKGVAGAVWLLFLVTPPSARHHHEAKPQAHPHPAAEERLRTDTEACPPRGEVRGEPDGQRGQADQADERHQPRHLIDIVCMT